MLRNGWNWLVHSFRGMTLVTTRFEAFLSYTRPDDRFFGGNITAMCQVLELGVQVVTGNRDFTIFQDVDGIGLGEDWRDKLADAIAGSVFFVPVITALYFTSPACRDELERFQQHEASLGRKDLILPIYFVTAPVLERPELLDTDPLATLIAGRQRFDYRGQANGIPTDPENRGVLLQLAGQIAEAMARAGTEPVPVARAAQTVAVDPEVRQLVEDLDQARGPALVGGRTLVLWVDDRPNNNVLERQAMATYGIDFVLAESTDAALQELGRHNFDAIVSDMGRPPDPQAGYTLLEAVRRRGVQLPYFIYAGSRDPAHVREALSRGAQGTTNRGDELLKLLLSAGIIRPTG